MSRHLNRWDRESHDDPTALLRVLVDIQERYIIEGTSRAWWDFVLDRIVDLTGSDFGFIGRIDRSGERPVLHTLGITNIAWNDWSQEVYDTYAEQGLVFDNPKSLFGVTVTEGTTVISNDPVHDPRSGGLPEGHPPIVAYIGIPVSDRSGMVGMIGLANRPGGFDAAFVEEMRPLVAFIGEIVGREILARETAATAAQLAETEQVQRALYASNDLIVFVVGPDGLLRLANHGAADLLGRTVQHGAPVIEALVEEGDRAWLASLAHGDVAERRDVWFADSLGGSVAARVTASPIDLAGGNRGILVIGVDLSDRQALVASYSEQSRLAERVAELEAEDARSRLITEAVDSAVVSSDLDGVRAILHRVLAHVYPDARIALYVPNAVGELELDPRNRPVDALAGLISADDCWALRASRPHLSAPGQVLPGCRHFPADVVGICLPIEAAGECYGLIVMSFPPSAAALSEILKTHSTAIIQRFALVMAAVSLRESLSQRALTDDLTGLLNRAAFVDEVTRLLASARRRGSPSSMLLIDLDLFKEINDTLGHAAGDAMLVQIAAALADEVREGDICARFGGDEFAVLLPDTDHAAALGAAERLRDRIAGLDEQGSHCRASIGLVTVPAERAAEKTWDMLYRSADRALYQAKDTGRGAIIVADDGEADA